MPQTNGSLIRGFKPTARLHCKLAKAHEKDSWSWQGFARRLEGVWKPSVGASFGPLVGAQANAFVLPASKASSRAEATLGQSTKKNHIGTANGQADARSTPTGSSDFANSDPPIQGVPSVFGRFSLRPLEHSICSHQKACVSRTLVSTSSRPTSMADSARLDFSGPAI